MGNSSSSSSPSSSKASRAYEGNPETEREVPVSEPPHQEEVVVEEQAKEEVVLPAAPVSAVSTQNKKKRADNNNNKNKNSEREATLPVATAAAPSPMKFEDLVVLLLNIHRSSVNLPLELVVSIFTEYLDCRPITRRTSQRLLQSGNNANEKYLTLPIPLLRHFRPARVVVTVESHDQGWSSNDRRMHGTREGSFTWGEIALSSAPEERVEVYRNLHARKDWERQTKIFTSDDAFFAKMCEEYETRSHAVLRPSSSPFELLLFVRSAFPGWCNFIRFAEMEIFWSINADVQELIEEYVTKFPARK